MQLCNLIPKKSEKIISPEVAATLVELVEEQVEPVIPQKPIVKEQKPAEKQPDKAMKASEAYRTALTNPALSFPNYAKSNNIEIVIDGFKFEKKEGTLFITKEPRRIGIYNIEKLLQYKGYEIKSDTTVANEAIMLPKLREQWCVTAYEKKFLKKRKVLKVRESEYYKNSIVGQPKDGDIAREEVCISIPNENIEQLLVTDGLVDKIFDMYLRR